MLGREQRTSPPEVSAVAWEDLLRKIKLQEKPSMTEVRSGWGQSVPGHTEFSLIALSSMQGFQVPQQGIEMIPLLYQAPRQGSKNYMPGSGSTVFSRPNRRSESDWAAAHLDILQQFANKWVVIDRDRIVSSDVDPSEAVENARKEGVARPFLLFVQSQDDAVIF